MDIVYQDNKDMVVGHEYILTDVGSGLVTLHLYPGIREGKRNGVRL